ncbi:MAG: glycosyltransferase family 4 protein [Acidimicrobiia bacterium]
MAPGPAELAVRPGELMKVGIVCPYDLDKPGGVQQLCLELGERLRDAGDDAVVVGPGRSESGDGTVRVGSSVGIKANRSVAPVTLAPGVWARVKAALSDVDVVHIHEPLVPLVGWAALSMNKPAVVTLHADAPGWVGKAYRVFPGRALRRPVLTAVSSVASGSIPSSWGEVRIIPNAIDVAAYQVEVERVPGRIAFLGRDEPRKGLDIALEAFVLIRSEHPGAELVVMGADRTGPVPPGVEFRGFVRTPDKHRILASSSIYVAPNTGGESFGIVLAEAMAAGCAVVASDLSAFRAVVGDDAVLVPVGDSNALARAVSELLSDPARVERLGNAGTARVDRFDWPHVLGQYRQAYADAIADG